MTVKSIGLCMIVKNEASVIVRCLDSVRPLIDFVLIEDTGSTDGTQEIIRNWLTEKGIAGTVVEEPWHDFAYNRSHALACLRKTEHIDYAFIIDADDTLTLDPGFDVVAFKSTMEADFYDVPINHGPIRHYRPQICSNRKDFYFRGVLHEFLETPPGPHSRETASGFAIQINGGGARSQDPQKFRKDAELLERALQNETDAFLRSRYTFYLAQSYRDFGEKQKALDLYLSRAEMGFWQEEIYVALLGAARLKEELEFPEDDVIAAYQRATESQPARTEALHGASRYCRYKGRNQLGAEIARRGIDLPLPLGALFSEGWIYEWGLLDEHAINAYWAGDYHSCIADCLRILERAKIDEATRTRVIANARFAQDKLREVKPSSLVDASKATFATTPPPKVLIAILAKSKAGHLPLFLECIEALDYPPEYISLHIRTNNNKDATAEILRDWVARVGARYAHVEFDDSDVAERVQDFDDHEWNTTRFSVLGRIRQHSIDQALALGCDFYFVVDVDNYLRPLTLRNLVDLNLPIVAPLLRCVDTDRPNYSNYHQIVDANGYFLDSVEYHKILERASPGLHEVALVHCTYLIRADTIPRLTYDDASYRYEYVIFSASARKEGIPQVLDTREVYGWLTFGLDGEAIRPLLAAELTEQSLKRALANTVYPPSQNAERAIRLKEYPPLASISNTPSDDYVKARQALEQKPYLLETDALGFIRGTNSPTQSTHTLVVLGDGVVECMYLDPDDRFCAKLETLARGEFGVDVAVKNGGYSGATTLHMLNVFMNKIIPMKPDLVILMTGNVDVDVAHVPASFWSRDCWIEPIVELSKDNRWRDNNSFPAPSFADRRRLLDLFSAAARAFDIELWFATVPHRRGDNVDPAKTRARLSINEVTRAAARAGGHTLCDLEVALAECYDIFQDDFHLNRAGSETLARSLLAKSLEFFQCSTAKVAAKAMPVHSIGEINVINLDRSTKRWELFNDRNKNLGPYTRYSAVDGHMVDRSSLETEGIIAPGLDYSPGALGCALSHIRLWQQAVDQNVPLTIFEDDAFGHPQFNEHWRTVAAQLPDDWDAVLWGYVYDPLFIWTDLGFSSSEVRFYDRAPAFTWNDTANGRSIYSPVRLRHAFGTQAYSISPRGAKRFLDALLPLKKQFVPFPGTSIVNEDQGIDGAMNLVYPKTQSYICIPPLVVHRDDGVSDRLEGLESDSRPLLDEPISS
ncbi:glycosyltransferase family 25 protein [Bradyrhizobium sp. AUGA SZCCT0182]|uniref:glycosyltransferase family 25 protein n=1 Tax=Bradyrhizobium sp. AUGA SZCCT0182 TaxID=2807667 RepID=UPI0020127B88|nr:glycosyltransferase family 25 protein [Bradyrhizobium sp. AUGA SZCCT0182]